MCGLNRLKRRITFAISKKQTELWAEERNNRARERVFAQIKEKHGMGWANLRGSMYK
ncbi:transposase [uncultured Paenibacillus sp.]|uniref:transposase n=1 Tax=uncultured Paenibacillus sp. TaxID=227322 RepID=UPI0025D1C2E8|nr:transposase [uncultured Paenibacillus sp.]